MLTSTLQEAVDANAGDILDFLERTSRSIPFYKQEPEQSDETGRSSFFEVERRDQIVSIYARCSASDEQRDEIIRFEVVERTKSISLINAFYQHDAPQVLLLFYRIWTRLAIGFGAPFAGIALTKLRELE